MFQILGIFSGIEVSMTSGIYSVVARVYDMMIDLATYDDAIALTSLTNLTQTCYVLAGVFMLFRTVIGLIQMLVNPDKVNDGNAGAGKLISRIVISIVLLLVLQPQGILFNPSTGLFPRIENALLASDGLITNLIDGNVANSSGSDDSSNSNNSSSNVTGSIEEGAEAIKDVTQSTVNNNYSSIGDYLIEDVYADDKLICYYYDLEKVPDYSDPDAPDDITVSSFYKITFTTTKTNGYAKMRGLVAGDNVDGDVYYYVSNARVLSGEFGDDFRYQSLPNNRRLYDTDKLFYYSEGIWSWSDKRAVLPDKCPEYLDTSGGKNADIGVRKSAGNVRKGLIGGYTSPRAMIKDIDKTYEEENVTSNNNPAVESHDASNNNEFLTDLNHRDASLGFAQKAASSFHTCASGAEDECLDAQTEMFGSVEGNNNLENLIDEDKLDIGFIISMVVGIALMIYLLILCVDVIIRKFKLTLLQVIAPIPAISYVDPNDKIFNQWMKMYIATYVDLFIKLLAISLALGLLQGTLDSNIWGDNLLYRFFYIVAILVFAKLVPGMISKIFGLDSMGGSFKDILGMGKAAAGFGAGAVLGGAVGAATGKGLGRLSGLTKGAMMGAGSGAKGNITGGSQGISARNARINDAKENGLGFWQRTAAGIAGTVGYSPKTRMDNKIKEAVDKKEMLDNFRKHKDNIENIADSSNYMSDLKVKMENGLITKDQFKQARSRFIEINEKGRKNEAGFYEIQNDDGSWSVARIGVEGLDDSPIKYEKSAVGKISQAEAEMRAEFNSSHALQKELGMEGKSINNFKAYEDAEGKAREKSNQYSTQIIEVQKSDEYGRAQAFEDYSKKS